MLNVLNEWQPCDALSLVTLLCFLISLLPLYVNNALYYLGCGRVSIFYSFKTWFLLFLATAVGPYIINLLIGAGVGYVTYELGSFAITEVFNDVKSSLTGLPS